MGNRTNEEKKLLKMLAEGLLDGWVGDDWPSGKSFMWRAVINGVPQLLRQGPGGKFFNGKENERYDGKVAVKQTWSTEEEKLSFLQKYGWLMNNEAAKSYSAKFKPNK